MKNSHRILLSCVVYALLLVACNVHVKLSGGNSYTIDNRSAFEWGDSPASWACQSSQLVGEVPVLVRHKGQTLFEQGSGCRPLILEIEKLDTGAFWSPVYKHSKFSASGYGYIEEGNAGGDMVKGKVWCKFSCEGTTTARGLLSPAEAARVTKERIIKDLVSHLHDRLKEAGLKEE